MFYVYVLHSLEDHGLYIGVSTDLRRRMAEHKGRASFATKYRGPWKFIYYEAYTERLDAEGREPAGHQDGSKLQRSTHVRTLLI